MPNIIRSHAQLALFCVSILVALPATLAAITGEFATNTATTVTYQFSYTGSPTYSRTYIDTDRNAATGLAVGGVGADYLLENANLYRYIGSGWSWTLVGTVTYVSSGGTAKWTVPRANIGETATPNDADLVFQVEPPMETSAKYTHVYTGGGDGSVAYTPTTVNFANPERGFYHHTGDCDKTNFSLAILQNYRTSESITLVMCVFYLAEFKTTAISQAALNHLQRQLDTVRAARLKLLLRFAYTTSEDGADATKDQVLSHLDQLKPYLNANKDVIYVVQAGFIGAWGEWYYTRNFGNAGTITSADWANRKAVVDKILSVLPSTRMVLLRTPNFKRTLYSTSPVTSGQAYGGSDVARIGHHNDCFLASSTDFGTYQNTAAEYPYLEAETQFVAMCGETCNPNPPRSECSTAEEELSRFHWSSLNTDYHAGVLGRWSTGGCLAKITRSLGYRFVLQSGTYPIAVTRGGALSINITLKNDGYAAPFNPRGLELVLRSTSTSTVHRFSLTDDPRRWAAGTVKKIIQTINLPTSIPSGSYELLLNLPDPLLADRPEYSIRLANEGTWELATGMNKLLRTITVI